MSVVPRTATLCTAVAIALASSVVAPAAAFDPVGVPVGNLSIAIAVAPDDSLAFVSDGNDGLIRVIDIESSGVIDSFPGTFGAGGIALRPGTDDLWVMSATANEIRVRDTRTGTLKESITVSGGPVAVTFAPDQSRAYVAAEGGDRIAVIDPATGTEIDSYPTGDRPLAVALDVERNNLVVANAGSDTLSIIDRASGGTRTIDVGDEPVDVIVDARHDQAIVVERSARTISFIDLVTETVVATRSTAGSPGTGGAGEAPAAIDALFDDRLLFVTAGDRVDVWDLENRRYLYEWRTGAALVDIVASPLGRGVYTVSRSTREFEIVTLETTRFGGADRYETAILLSQEMYPASHSVAFVASGTAFPDALAIAPAAARDAGPLLLTPPRALRADVRDELDRLNPSTIYIAGGPGAVSPAVEAELAATGATVIRVGGADRFATSREVVRAFFDDPAGYQDLYLVTGRTFPDALSAGAAAGNGRMPMLLIDGRAAALPDATLNLIDELRPTRVILVGGPGAVSRSIQDQLTAVGSFSVVRAGGADRFETSRAVNELAFSGRLRNETFWATGLDFPDALAGVTLTGPRQAPIYLVRPTCIPDGAIHGAWRHRTPAVVILGGPGAVSPEAASFTRC